VFKNIFVSVLIWVIEALVVAAMISVSWSHRIGELEEKWMISYIGQEQTEIIQAKAQALYSGAFLETGVMENSYYFFIPSEEERSRSLGFEDFGRKDIFPFIRSRLDVIWMSVYQICQRIFMIGIWAPYALILLVPFITDGMVNRKIKQYGFDYSSPFLHRYSVWVFGLVCYISFLALFAPIPIPISIMPFACMLMAVSLGVFASNVQKRL